MTFLQIITRTCKRPALLAKNKASLAAQTCNDWQQRIIVDDVGRGIEWAQANLAILSPTGCDYVWLLDDDDECIYPAFVQELKDIAAQHNPDVIMVKMDHGQLGILPDENHWQQPPTYGFIGCSAYVVKREVWDKHKHVWLNGRYYTDHEFISDVFDSNPAVYWHDVIASRVQRISNGVPG